MSHLDLLTYSKPITFMVGITNMYGIIFYQVYLLPWLVMLYLDSGSPQHLYQIMQEYVVIGLMKIYWSKSSEKIIPNSICIILWRIMCMVSIKEEIVPIPPFQSSGTLLVILSVSSNVGFGDTSELLLIGPYSMCSGDKNKCALKIEKTIG